MGIRYIMKDLIADFDNLLSTTEKKEPKCQCIVRLTTTYWHDQDGVYKKQSLKYLKRKCIGFNILYEDASNINVGEVINRIENLDECKDGIYQVITCNEYGHWETPNIIEDYDYKLIPL